jgi:hypothetical protein
MTIKEDFEKPLKSLYEELPRNTQEAIDKDASKIWIYVISWCAFVGLSIVGIIYLIETNPLNRPIDTWFQRSGSIITLLAGFSEVVFLIKLNELVKISHPAQLSCEIYIERTFKPLLYITVVSTIIFVSLGTLIWGYGDLLYS